MGMSAASSSFATMGAPTSIVVMRSRSAVRLQSPAAGGGSSGSLVVPLGEPPSPDGLVVVVLELGTVLELVAGLLVAVAGSVFVVLGCSHDAVRASLALGFGSSCPDALGPGCELG